MRKNFLLLLLVFLLNLTFIYSKNGNYFIENKGQWSPEVKFLAQTGGINAWITDNGVVYDFYKIESKKQNELTDDFKKNDVVPWKTDNGKSKTDNIITGHVVKMSFVNSSREKRFNGINKSLTYYNYFIGNDKSKWANYVGLYDEIKTKGVRNGIDCRYYFENSKIRYDFIIHPGVNPSILSLDFDLGEDKQFSKYINPEGELVLKTSVGEIIQGKIFAYQEIESVKNEIPCRFNINPDSKVNFQLGEYDRNQELIIDPIIWSTFIGGAGDDRAKKIEIDTEGNSYITGTTTIPSFYPITIGAYKDSLDGVRDIIITKINSSGSNLLFSTYIGGKFNDGGNDIIIDESGNIILAGWTWSNDFPVTEHVYQKTNNGFSDAFLTKLSPSGDELIASTMLGGSFESDWITGISMDGDENIFVTGITASANFPVSGNAFQKSMITRAEHVFVSKLNSDLSELIYSTYLAGSGAENSVDIAVDISGCAYVTGNTWSSNFPTTKGAFQNSRKDDFEDVFVTKLNQTGSKLEFSTYLGGSGFDEVHCIFVDDSGCAYVTGRTLSLDFPTTNNLFPHNDSGFDEVFVTKFNNIGTRMEYSVLFGGNNNDVAEAIFVDNLNNVYIAGSTWSKNYPYTLGAIQDTIKGTSDGFITIFNLNDTNLIYSTYIGGGYSDWIFSSVLDKAGNLFLTGATSSSDYPITSGVFQKTFAGVFDVFVTKLDLKPNNKILINEIPSKVCIGSSIKIPFVSIGEFDSTNTFTAQLSDENGNFDNAVDIGSIQSTTSGTITAFIPKNILPGISYKIRIVSSNPVVIASSPNSEITIQPLTEITFNEFPEICLQDNPLILNYAIPEGGIYSGSGIHSNIFYPDEAGSGKHAITYYYSNEKGCENSATQTIKVLPAPEKPKISQYGKSLYSNSTNGNQWYLNGNKIEGATGQTYTPDSSGYFTLIVTGDNGCESEMSAPYYFDITDVPDIINQEFKLFIIPNPFNGITKISWLLENQSNVILTITNLIGQEVFNFNEFQTAGQHTIEFNSSELPAGIYFCTLKAGGYTETVKMVVVK